MYSPLRPVIANVVLSGLVALASTASADPVIVGSGPMSLGSCGAVASAANAEESRSKLIELLKIKIAEFPNIQSLKDMLASEENSTHRERALAVAQRTSGFLQVQLDQGYRLPLANFKDQSGLGWIDIEGSEFQGPTVLITPDQAAISAVPGITVIKVYGTKYCAALKAGPDWTAAVLRDLFQGKSAP